jgi:ATP-dependent phosphofructokinase / diphosphate-dependent phosphofructokinase
MTKPVAVLFCAGGPAPGFNGVTHGSTSTLEPLGYEILGLWDGLLTVMQGRPMFTKLTTEQTAQYSKKGGGKNGTSRANPTKKEEDLDTVAAFLQKRRAVILITIGGDDTAKTANAIARKLGKQIIVVHVPKTIDDDLPLPLGFHTFGYRTAVHYGAEKLITLKEDACTTGDRHFVEIVMGRHSGWLPLGVAAKSESLVLIPEEFPDQTTAEIVIDILVGGSLKAAALAKLSDTPIALRGASHVVAEGMFERIEYYEKLVRDYFPAVEEDLFDPHGNLRFSKVPIDTLFGFMISRRLRELGVPKALKASQRKLDVFCQKCGFELRCRPPIPEDYRYCVELGQEAAKLAHQKVSQVMVVPCEDGYTTMPFSEFIGPDGKARTRSVSMDHPDYQQLLKKRFSPSDLENDPLVDAMAGLTNLSRAEFKETFAPSAEVACRHAR